MFLLGLEINLVWTALVILTVGISVGGLITTNANFHALVPAAAAEAYRYGRAKRSVGGDAFARLTEVPKSWFFHFYVFATAHHASWFVLVTAVYLLERPAPQLALDFLDFVGTSDRSASATPERVFLAMSLFLFQATRRLYECFYVHAPSSSKMSVLHYLAGFAHYACVTLAMLLEAPGFASGAVRVQHQDLGQDSGLRWLHLELSWKNLRPGDAWWTVVFLWASLQQHRCHRILADLRKPKPGEDASSSSPSNQSRYSLPRGSWFELVSCPNYTFEVLIYVCLSGVLGLKHRSAALLAVWVFVNQTVMAIMGHFWYQDKFPEYPRNRRAIIPYIL